MSAAPGQIRDSIVDYLGGCPGAASAKEIVQAVTARLGVASTSSVRSYLSLNTPNVFERVSRGRYKLRASPDAFGSLCESGVEFVHPLRIDRAVLHRGNCFDWFAAQKSNSVHAIVTDPPYGLLEFTEKETTKLRSGRGGVWRIPPSYDGYVRAPLPRFTVLGEGDRRELYLFFKRLGVLIRRVAVPGANVIVASNPLLAHIVAVAMADVGLELRGYIVRQVMTMRGGDRPKNAHHEFDGVSVMPRSQWEPWVVLRNPLDGRAQDNLRKWKTGGFRRPSPERPFGDLIRSNPTPAAEKKIAPHPSLKPQAFMRTIVRAALPLGEGVVLDPFMGAGSTLAAANAVGYESIGVELDGEFFRLAQRAVEKLSRVSVPDNRV